MQLSRGGSSPKILGGIAPSGSAASSPSPFSPLSETEKIRTSYIGLHLKSIINRIANSVTGSTLRPVRNEARRAERVGVEFLEGGQRAPSPSARGSGERCKHSQLGPGRSPEKFDFGAF